MSTLIISDASGNTVFTFTGKLLLADFLLSAAPGDYSFLIEQDDIQQRGTFTVRQRGKDALNANLQGMLNYITSRHAAGNPGHRSELTFSGNKLAGELIERGLVKMDDDHRYIPA